MREAHRFASLNGAGRKWLTEDEFEPDAEAGSDLDASARGRPGADAEHDGWEAMLPRRQSLARLGDVFPL